MRMVQYISKYWNVFLLLTILVFAAYGNSLGNTFLSDDHGLEQVLPTMNLSYILARPTTGMLRNVVYFIVYIFASLTPWAFRLTNIAFHLANTILIFILVKKLMNQRTAFFSSVIFAVHPLLVESITWVAGGVYPQYSFFFLLALVSYLYSYQKKGLYALSVMSFALSLLSSDKAVVLFPLFVGVEFCFDNLKKNWQRLIPYFVATLILASALVFTSQVSQRVALLQNDYYQQRGNDDMFVKLPTILSSYFELYIWPQRLTFYHSEFHIPQLEFAIRLIVTGLFFLSGLVALYFNRKLAYWFLFFVTPVLLTLTPLRVAWAVAERYIYLSLIGLTTLSGYAISLLWQKKQLKTIITILFVLVIGALLTRTIIRNMDFRDDDALWLATNIYSPNSTQNLNNLGDYYARKGDYQKSITSYEKALKLNPNYADVYNNLANTYGQMGQSEKAISLYEKAISINPGLWQTYQNIASLYVNSKQYDLAVANMEKARDVHPEIARVWSNLGVTYQLAGLTDKARTAFEQALRLDPNEQGAIDGLAKISKSQL